MYLTSDKYIICFTGEGAKWKGEPTHSMSQKAGKAITFPAGPQHEHTPHSSKMSVQSSFLTKKDSAPSFINQKKQPHK